MNGAAQGRTSFWRRLEEIGPFGALVLAGLIAALFGGPIWHWYKGAELSRVREMGTPVEGTLLYRRSVWGLEGSQQTGQQQRWTTQVKITFEHPAGRKRIYKGVWPGKLEGLKVGDKVMLRVLREDGALSVVPETYGEER